MPNKAKRDNRKTLIGIAGLGITVGIAASRKTKPIPKNSVITKPKSLAILSTKAKRVANADNYSILNRREANRSIVTQRVNKINRTYFANHIDDNPHLLWLREKGYNFKGDNYKLVKPYKGTKAYNTKASKLDYVPDALKASDRRDRSKRVKEILGEISNYSGVTI